MKYFPEIKKIRYEGPATNNDLAYKYYQPNKKIRGKKMADILKFAVAYWHTMKGTGADPFGGGVYSRPWNTGSTEIETAERTMDALFEFVGKLGIKYYCFHDTDIAPEGDSIKEYAKNLKHIVKLAKAHQKKTGIKLLWGTANLFSHPRYTNGAATNPDPQIFARAATQVRHALDATVELGGTGYVFWGGREGYSTILNTDLKQEREQLARMLWLAVEHGKKNGFKGKFFIEPKPKEPSKHQYDFDSATVLGFLNEFGLAPYFQLNIEANHATLAGHTFEHELATASSCGMLGSMDINIGDPTLGWDTDEFPTDLKGATLAMMTVLSQGGLKYGGMNFDAKVRRGSFDSVDLFYAHISGIDTFAKALLIADKILKDKFFSNYLKSRYAGFKRGMGAKIMKGDTSLKQLEKWAVANGEPPMVSGRQEFLEKKLNDYIFKS